ncbi:MAG TPA: tripartite tricarboxylate transporter TctB family protein [Thermodesulfobacteriota bacterium]|nr:tripartite tricarboxylate transporter TctB family protein [Thermodesulfobacteriota bacterium]
MRAWNNEQASAIAWFCCGILILLASRRYGLGSSDQLGTGFMPFLAGAAISAFSLAGFIVETVRKKPGAGWKSILKGVAWRRAAIVLAALYAYTVFLNRAGFLVCTGLFVGVLMKSIYPQRWSVTILWAIVVTAASFLIFDVWLKAQLPRGRWGI